MDWKPGDLALCVRDGVNTRAGQSFTVARVLGMLNFAPWQDLPGRDCAALLFREVAHPSNPNGLFAEARFRKINPLSDEEQDAFYRDLLEPRELPPVKNPKELV